MNKILIFSAIVLLFIGCEDTEKKGDSGNDIVLMTSLLAASSQSNDCRTIPATYTIAPSGKIFNCTANGYTITCTSNSGDINTYKFGSYQNFKASLLDLPYSADSLLVGFRGSEIINARPGDGTTVTINFSQNGAAWRQTTIGSGFPGGVTFITPIDYSSPDSQGSFTAINASGVGSTASYLYSGTYPSQIVDSVGTRGYTNGVLTSFTGISSHTNDFTVTSSGALTLCK